MIALAGLLGVLAFPFAAAASVPTPPPLAEGAVALPPLRRAPAGTSLRTMPLFTGADTAAAVAHGGLSTNEPALAAAIARASTTVFGGAGDGGLAALIGNPFQPPIATLEGVNYAYPLRFQTLDPILDARLGRPAAAAKVPAVNDMAGLLELAAAEFPSKFPNGAQVAYELYDRARGGGACAPQLNLAFLLTTDYVTHGTDTSTELERAAKDCPGDPTPLWLLGQYESLRGGPALATFARLENLYPGSALGWAGEADALLRDAYAVDVAEPFTARTEFRRALVLYQRAEMLDHDPGLAAGEARAAAGLDDFAGASSAQRRALAVAPLSLSFQVRLVDYLERGRRFAEAVSVNAGYLGAKTRLASGPGLAAGASDEGDEVGSEGALGPVSIGTNRFQAVQLEVSGIGPLPFTGGVADMSFIPQFRDSGGLRVPEPWCPQWTLTRDLVLAGRATEALRSFPASFADARPGFTSCGGDPGLLRAVATYESGDEAGAVAGFQPFSIPPEFRRYADPRLPLILEADQDLWRYAGNDRRAATVAAAWIAAEPADLLGPDRAGEIAFLQKDYTTASSDFALAVRRATGETVAHEQLKEGAALELAGDLTRALPLFRAADKSASALIPTDVEHATSVSDDLQQAVLDSYNARLQAGDTGLRSHEFAEAETNYRAARAREAALNYFEGPTGLDPFHLDRREPLFRPEVLENNEALVLVELGRAKDALSLADAALKFDPANPVFLSNKGFVQEKLGDHTGAAASYRAALAIDPTVFPAANDLGVILAEEGHDAEAVQALRQALAANDHYARGEFNLGLVLDRMGPAHVLEAQGQFAAAARHDHSYRDHEHEFSLDDDTYFTTLDLSKPLPREWHFASNSSRTPITVAGAVLALLLLRLFADLFREHLSGEATEGALETTAHGLRPRIAELGSRIPGAVALVAVVAVLVYPLARSSGATAADALLLGGGVVFAALAFMRVRAAVARRNAVQVRHYPWLPAVLVGGAAAVLGVGFAPMPATSDDGTLPVHARWIGTGLLGAVSVILLVAGRLSYVPIATELGAVCLVMTSSALVPIKPYDGVFLERGHLGLYIALVLTGIGILLKVGVL